jgi:hypothetical protein
MNLQELVGTVNGATIISLDTETTLPLNKTITVNGERQPNPHFDRVKKRTTGLNVMIFSNQNSNGYENMVRKRLVAEGKDPNTFVLSERKWGVRIAGTPFVEHKGQTYIEVIMLRDPRSSTFHIGSKQIDYDDIHGQKKTTKAAQGGLDNSVIIRTFKTESIVAITINKQKHIL